RRRAPATTPRTRRPIRQDRVPTRPTLHRAPATTRPTLRQARDTISPISLALAPVLVLVLAPVPVLVLVPVLALVLALAPVLVLVPALATLRAASAPRAWFRPPHMVVGRVLTLASAPPFKARRMSM